MIRGLRLTVDASRDGVRLDRFLRLALPALPARSAAWAIATGGVTVGGGRAAKGTIVRGGDEVAIRAIPEEADWLPLPADLPGASVLYQDACVLVLDKPAGVHSEPQRPAEPGTLSGYLLRLHPGVAGFAGTPGLSLLSRLDHAVSGAVPAALSAEAFRFLVRERDEGRIRKVYACLVRGRVAAEMTVSAFLDTRGGEKVRVRAERSEPDPRYRTVVSPVRLEGPVTLVHAAIAKGKRHQVRAHLASAGFPIVGDALYGADPPEAAGKGGLMMHAVEVSFVHPERRERITVNSPLPERFRVTG